MNQNTRDLTSQEMEGPLRNVPQPEKPSFLEQLSLDGRLSSEPPPVDSLSHQLAAQAQMEKHIASAIQHSSLSAANFADDLSEQLPEGRPSETHTVIDDQMEEESSDSSANELLQIAKPSKAGKYRGDYKRCHIQRFKEFYQGKPQWQYINEAMNGFLEGKLISQISWNEVQFSRIVMAAGDDFVRCFRASKKQLLKHAAKEGWSQERLAAYRQSFNKCLSAMTNISSLTPAEQAVDAEIKKYWRKQA